LIHIEKCPLPHVETVEMNAKYHLSQKKADRCIAESAIQIINQLDVQTDLAVEALVDKDLAVADLVEEVQDHERCMMQHVEIVDRKEKVEKK
jgi:hypothetical protein